MTKQTVEDSKITFEVTSNKDRLENALLEYIEKNIKDTTPEIAATIPRVAMVLVELWKG